MQLYTVYFHKFMTLMSFASSENFQYKQKVFILLKIQLHT